MTIILRNVISRNLLRNIGTGSSRFGQKISLKIELTFYRINSDELFSFDQSFSRIPKRKVNYLPVNTSISTFQRTLNKTMRRYLKRNKRRVVPSNLKWSLEICNTNGFYKHEGHCSISFEIRKRRTINSHFGVIDFQAKKEYLLRIRSRYTTTASSSRINVRG